MIQIKATRAGQAPHVGCLPGMRIGYADERIARGSIARRSMHGAR
jgi:hypothetical protein